MREIFIATKNLELPSYLLFLIDKISPQQYVQSHRYVDADLIMVDTETMLPQELKKFRGEIPIILYCHHTRPFLLHYTRAFDVYGVFCLDMSPTELDQILTSASTKEMQYNESMISLLFSNSVNETIDRILQLTDREREILHLMKNDLTNEEIAEKLNLSVRTVNAHKGNIMRKMEMKTTGGLFQTLYDYDPEFRT